MQDPENPLNVKYNHAKEYRDEVDRKLAIEGRKILRKAKLDRELRASKELEKKEKKAQAEIDREIMREKKMRNNEIRKHKASRNSQIDRC